MVNVTKTFLQCTGLLLIYKNSLTVCWCFALDSQTGDAFDLHSSRVATTDVILS